MAANANKRDAKLDINLIKIHAHANVLKRVVQQIIGLISKLVHANVQLKNVLLVIYSIEIFVIVYVK